MAFLISQSVTTWNHVRFYLNIPKSQISIKALCNLYSIPLPLSLQSIVWKKSTQKKGRKMVCVCTVDQNNNNRIFPLFDLSVKQLKTQSYSIFYQRRQRKTAKPNIWTLILDIVSDQFCVSRLIN